MIACTSCAREEERAGKWTGSKNERRENQILNVETDRHDTDSTHYVTMCMWTGVPTVNCY